MAVAEVADEQVAAEPSETRGGERQAPRRVQLAVLRHADEQVPIRVEGVHEAEALAADESTLTSAAVPRDGFQPAIVPPSVAKMNGAPASLGPTRKLAEPPLNTIPVGAPSTLTLRFRLTPLAR